MLICAATVVSCDYLDTRYDSEITQDNIDNEYTRVIPMGYAAYGYMKNGLSEMDGNIAAAKSDEAAIYRRLVYRDAEEYLCILCLAKELGVEPRVIEDKIRYFKEIGCTLF